MQHPGSSIRGRGSSTTSRLLNPECRPRSPGGWICGVDELVTKFEYGAAAMLGKGAARVDGMATLHS